MTRSLSSFAEEGYKAPERAFKFSIGAVQAWDQALATTGMVEVIFGQTQSGRQVIRVTRAITLVPGLPLGGYPAMLKAAVEYEKLIQKYLWFQDVVYEDVPAMGFRLYRPESSLLAALAIEMACDKRHIEVSTVPAQVPKTDWAANPKATKVQLKNGILEKFPYLEEPMKRADEHQWDALGVALSHALVRE